MPHLRAVLGDGAIAGLCRTAEMAREDADALDDQAAQRLMTLLGPARGSGSAPVASLPDGSGGPPPVAAPLPPLPAAVMTEPAAVRSRVIREYLLAAGCPREQLTRDHVTQVGQAMTNRTHRVWLPGGLVAAGSATGLCVVSQHRSDGCGQPDGL
jgi:hypothetical protein